MGFATAFDELKTEVKRITDVLIDINPYKNTTFIRNIIHKFVVDLTNNTHSEIQNKNINSLDDVKNANVMIVGFSAVYNELFIRLKKFMRTFIYKSHLISIMDHKAEMVADTIFNKLMDTPKMLPPEWYDKYMKADDKPDPFSGMIMNRNRIICDYISCMTDRSALDEYERLTNPKTKL